MLNRRQLMILDILNKEKRMGIKDIAILTNASYKTIQNDINFINDKLSEINEKIICKTNAGLSFFSEDKNKFNDFMNKYKEKFEEYSCENNDLVIAFLSSLLIQGKMKKIDFMDQYFLTSSKMKTILDETREYLTKYNLALSYNKNYGIYLTGNEVNIRNLMIDILFLLDKNNKKKTLMTFFGNFFQLKSEINKLIITLFKEFDYKITYDAKESFLLAMITMLIRNKTKNVYLNEREIDYESNIYILSINIKELLEKYYDFKLDENEKYYIFHILNGVKKRHSKSINNIDVSKRQYLDTLVNNVLKRIDQKYSEDFSNNLELYTALFLHLYSLIERIESNFKINNPLLSDIVKNYPLACDMALEVSVIIEKEFDVLLDDNEVGYLAIYFNLAIEQKKQKIKKKNILVVSSSGGGLLQMLEMKIKNQFYRNINIIDSCELADIESINLNLYDFIFTTVPITQEIPNIKIINITNMFNQISSENMQIDLNKKKIRLVDLINKSLFYTNISGETKEIILKNICERVSETINISSNLYSEILKRERLFSTELGNLVAFPHPLDYTGNKTFISITILEKQIKWNNLNVQVIVLVAIANKDTKNLQDFYSDFVDFVNDEKRILNLIKEPSFNNLLKQFDI